MISNVNSSAIVTSSICEPLAIVTSHWSIILTLYLWTLSSSQWRCQPGRLSMAAHRYDRRGIYRCALLSFRGRIEIDHSCGLRCRSLCCHSRHSTRGAGRKRPRNGRCSIPNWPAVTEWPGTDIARWSAGYNAAKPIVFYNTFRHPSKTQNYCKVFMFLGANIFPCL